MLNKNSLWSADKLDEKAIIKTSRELFDIQSEINQKNVLAQIKIAELLTPDQRSRLPNNMGFMNGFSMMYNWNNQEYFFNNK